VVTARCGRSAIGCGCRRPGMDRCARAVRWKSSVPMYTSTSDRPLLLATALCRNRRHRTSPFGMLRFIQIRWRKYLFRSCVDCRLHHRTCVHPFRHVGRVAKRAGASTGSERRSFLIGHQQLIGTPPPPLIRTGAPQATRAAPAVWKKPNESENIGLEESIVSRVYRCARPAARLIENFKIKWMLRRVITIGVASQPDALRA